MATTGIQDCGVIQIVEPDGDLPVDTTGATSDPTLTERGEEILSVGQSVVTVLFQTQKINSGYKFEYLYVDALGVTNPGAINPVPIAQGVNGFTVDLAGEPPVAGYILRWRVVVATVSAIAIIDAPESFRVQLPNLFPTSVPITTLTIPFVNPRSTTDYGFSEFRIENLTDSPDTQSPIAVQVYAKTTSDFSICWNPFVPTGNYYLVARTP